jgi:hypothetical protein
MIWDKLWEHFGEHHMEQGKKNHPRTSPPLSQKGERMGLLGGLSSNNDFFEK